MLIEQHIEFELTGPGPHGHSCTPTGYFCDKTKISKENLREDYCLLLKYFIYLFHVEDVRKAQKTH